MEPHRDNIVVCASCGAGLDQRGTRFVCGKCGGALVTNGELESMLDELSPDAKIPLSSRFVAAKATSAPRSCPRCATTMAQVSMYGVPLDHCAEHGVWFDVNELANVLNENGQAYADRTAPKNTNRAFAIADILLGRPLTALADWLWWSRRTPKTPADASLPEKS